MFTASWLLLYAAAGLLAHSSLGHNHLHGPFDLKLASHAAEPAAEGDSQAGRADDCPFHQHRAQSQAPANDDCDSTCDHQHADHDHSHHSHPDHEDCVGCKLLGSISAPALAVVLEETGRLVSAAPILEVSFSPVAVAGVHLARAPPVA